MAAYSDTCACAGRVTSSRVNVAVNRGGELIQPLAIFGAATQHGEKSRTSVASDPVEMSESGNQEPALAPNDNGSPTNRPPRPAVGNKVTVVLGAQWGDEGKGKVVDLLAQDADMVCRCQVC